MIDSFQLLLEDLVEPVQFSDQVLRFPLTGSATMQLMQFCSGANHLISPSNAFEVNSLQLACLTTENAFEAYRPSRCRQACP